MLTRRTFLAAGAGALAVTAAGGAMAAPSALASTSLAPSLALVRAGMDTGPAVTATHVVLGGDRLANLRRIAQVLSAHDGAPVALALDAADHMLFEIAAADTGRAPIATLPLSTLRMGA